MFVTQPELNYESKLSAVRETGYSMFVIMRASGRIRIILRDFIIGSFFFFFFFDELMIDFLMMDLFIYSCRIKSIDWNYKE